MPEAQQELSGHPILATIDRFQGPYAVALDPMMKSLRQATITDYSALPLANMDRDVPWVTLSMPIDGDDLEPVCNSIRAPALAELTLLSTSGYPIREFAHLGPLFQSPLATQLQTLQVSCDPKALKTTRQFLAQWQSKIPEIIIVEKDTYHRNWGIGLRLKLDVGGHYNRVEIDFDCAKEPEEWAPRNVAAVLSMFADPAPTGLTELVLKTRQRKINVEAIEPLRSLQRAFRFATLPEQLT